MKKVLAVASIGGHWIQLLRIARPMEGHYEMVYVSTHPKCATMVEGQKFCQTTDFSRSNAWKLIPAFFRQEGLQLYSSPESIRSGNIWLQPKSIIPETSLDNH